jgi:hypothetical protein
MFIQAKTSGFFSSWYYYFILAIANLNLFQLPPKKSPRQVRVCYIYKAIPPHFLHNCSIFSHPSPRNLESDLASCSCLALL